jgi:hypothetical protein
MVCVYIYIYIYIYITVEEGVGDEAAGVQDEGLVRDQGVAVHLQIRLGHAALYMYMYACTRICTFRE